MIRVKLILASASPRRKELLARAGFVFEVVPSDYDEPPPQGPVDIRSYVRELAYQKAITVAARWRDAVVLSADTACSIHGEILNKPADRADAERMIRLQEGRELDVWTGLALYRAGAEKWLRTEECSRVFVRMLSDAERTAYLDSGLWRGKAGGYGVQDDDPFVSIRTGSATNVVGLPMERVVALLAAWGIHPERSA